MPVAYTEPRSSAHETCQRLRARSLSIWQAVVYCQGQLLVKASERISGAVTVFCRSWGCERCRPRRCKQLIAEAIRGQPNKLLTLTSRVGVNLTPDAQARDLRAAFTILRKRIIAEHHRDPAKKPTPPGPVPEGGWLRDHRGQVQRQVRLPDGRFPYLGVFERTKEGYPHLHILLRADWIDQKWLSAQMAELHASPIVDIRKIDNPGRAGSYVSKYIGKDPTRFEGCKRYTKTRDYEVLAREVKALMEGILGKWTRDTLSLVDWIAFRSWEGCEIERPCERSAIARRPP